MYELNGNIKELNIDFLTGKALLTLLVNEKQSEKINSKLEQLVQQYQRAGENTNTAKSNEAKPQVTNTYDDDHNVLLIGIA